MQLDLHRIRVADTLEEKRAAALTVIGWGYPRQIKQNEVELAFWIHYGPTVIYWFEWVDCDITTERLVLHVCSDPESRGSFFARRWLYSVGIIAEILNARALFVEKSIGEEPIIEYLVRMGWEASEGGYIFHLHGFGESDGEQTRPEGSETRPDSDCSRVGSGRSETPGT